jgi:hypothetical protein
MIDAAVTNEAVVLPRASLDCVRRDAMFALLSRHFDGVAREQFERDLDEKSHAILIERDGALVGFSTLLVYETTFERAPVSVVYSGDTIVAPEAWGTTALPRAWIASVNRLRRDFPRGKFYWLLITSGFRTYRFLPVFWREFWPRFDAQPPESIARLHEHLARERFGDAFDATRGIVRFSRPQRLRGELAAIPAGRDNDPHIAFFLERNRGHADGDELVCLTELCDENLTAAGRRMIASPPRRHAR